MGIFYYIHSVALIEDLPIEHFYHDPKKFYADADKAYNQVSNSSYHVPLINTPKLSILARLKEHTMWIN